VPDPGLKIGCSIGVSVFPADSADFAEVLRLADKAMYEAKGRGKNKFCLAAKP